ncbi:GDP-mannose-dependent alpha-(1-6)-phosphatidylinositol monomannoside mannosyltransferase [Turicibacter sanguinis]|nr:GDP-mannose-dependent alpha-(1-6)-phosphatidylinositol monomannoside mannosyltransferase [Turicibacter sanguinis]
MNKKKIKVLQVLPCLTQTNGIAAYISNYFKYMDKKNLEMYFLVFTPSSNDRNKEIIKFGGKIIELYIEKNLFRYLSKLNRLIKKEKFDIIHCHVPNYGALIMPIAKMNKIPIRITHSHVNKSGETLLKRVRNDILSQISVLFSNKYLACSDDAGKFLFYKKKFVVIKNAIEVKKYEYSKDLRMKYQKKYNIENKFVVAQFGRLCNQKNQLFTIEIFNEILKKNNNSVLILAGDGPLEEKIRIKIKELNIEDNVILTGSCKELNELYSCIDIFLLPSKYEGLGIVLIEAQANGVKCFTALNCVPQTAAITDLVKYISLEKNAKYWCDEIISTDIKRKQVSDLIDKNGYNIQLEAKKLNDIYIKFMKEEM